MSYEEDIVPIFKGWCISCHQPGGQGYKASGVDLTSYAGLMKGTKFGTVVISKEPDTSTLVALIYGRTSPKIRMPFGHKPFPNCLRTKSGNGFLRARKTIDDLRPSSRFTHSAPRFQVSF
jgi:hypothetical protein